jgi:hypothetical protein
MRQISSSSTWSYKHVVPFFVLLASFAIALFLGVGAGRQRGDLRIVFIPLAFGLTGFVLLKLLYRSYVDEVWIDDREVVISNHGIQERFPVSNIASVDGSRILNPEYITLTLKEKCNLADPVYFLPPQRFGRFTEHPIVIELQELIARPPLTEADVAARHT